MTHTARWLTDWPQRARYGLALLIAAPIVATSILATPAHAQHHRWHDKGFAFRRVVEVPAGMETLPDVIVGEFFTHGTLTGADKDVVVYANRELVPTYLLQQGPGDFCRVAFQPVENQLRYFIYYGGLATEDAERPKWSAHSGLLFETREWRPCDMTKFESVRDAFASSKRIGSDLVGGVFHRHNPFASEPGPFLSRYVGILHAPLKGDYVFYTSSQDCSFVVIDGKQVVAAPGAHAPETQAKIKGIVPLNPGPHQFEYYHGASGADCCMVVAWASPGLDKLGKISPAFFGYDRVLRVPPVDLEHRDDGYLPDFRMAILGDIPSPDEKEPAMVRAQLINVTTPTISANAKYEWSFGDGQQSEFENPAHVFLHTGLYRVGLKLNRANKPREIANRIYVTRQFMIDTKGQEGENLAEYLEALKHYNSQNLDAMALVQLVRAYLLTDDFVNAAQAAEAAFSPSATEHTDQSRWLLAQLVGPVLRENLNNPKAATNLWTMASQQIKNKEWSAECAVEAADTLLNDLLEVQAARGTLAFAESFLPEATALTRSRYYRVLGDWYARTGSGKNGRATYFKASTARELPYNTIESNAARGSHSRTSEAFLRGEEWARAREELQKWQRDFPADKSEGFLSLLQMRYWIARGKLPQAIAVASDLLVVNPHSPYADQLVYLTAQCEVKANQLGRAIAAYQSLVTDYPGSPLVESAKAAIKQITEAAATNPAIDEKTRGRDKKQ